MLGTADTALTRFSGFALCQVVLEDAKPLYAPALHQERPDAASGRPARRGRRQGQHAELVVSGRVGGDTKGALRKLGMELC
jgi:hypothetical protein